MSSMVRIRLEPIGKELEVRHNTPLKDVISGLGIEFPCGSKGKCGKCKVRIIEGSIATDHIHREQLEKLKIGADFRLSCRSFITGNVTIEVQQFNEIILSDDSVFEFSPIEGYGIAFDLGTSTLISQLVDRSTGKVEEVHTRMNPQKKYGSDLISRIEYAVFRDGADDLKNSIREAFREMINGSDKRFLQEVRLIQVVGNTVMHHIFGGINLRPLASYPFELAENRALEFESRDLNLDTPPECRIMFLPPLGSFVGSDILSGILATGLHKSEKIAALVDLGTNGEIAVGNKERIIYSSTAAGPAFEGTNITHGMRAATGAISSAQNTGKGIQFHVIENVPAKGICGSGLIDLVSVFLETGKIDQGGRILNGNAVSITEGLVLNQKDIREFQLAKAAIATGLEILSEKFGRQVSELDKIYIAGAFGNFLNLENARSLGLLNCSEQKIQKMGNSALLGSKISLFNKENELTRIKSISEHCSLESQLDFQERFSRNLMFGPG